LEEGKKKRDGVRRENTKTGRRGRIRDRKRTHERPEKWQGVGIQLRAF
jgi:hypothetical protein